MRILIDPSGGIRAIYSDDLAELLAEGRSTVRRASHVEPASGGGWTADMGPVDGPILGPYQTRTEALKAETDWLMEHNVPVPKGE